MNSSQIPTVELGKGGPRVGAQGLGCMAFDDNDETSARTTLEVALETGITLFDTADVYGSGASERFLAPFLRAHRDDVVVGTKFGRVRRTPESRDGPAIRNDRAHIRSAVDASLRRLGVDVIDLYYMHRRNEQVPLAESVGAMAELVAEGKVKHLGLCEVSGAELLGAQAIHPIAAVQSEWSIFCREIEDSVVPVATELGVAVVPYSPLGRGFLTGTFTDAATELPGDDYRRHHPRLVGDNAKTNADLVVPLRTIAEHQGVTMGQVALAWIHQQADRHGLTAVVPIPGTRRADRVVENAAATRISLSERELALLEPIAGQVAGERFGSMTPRRDSRKLPSR